MRSRNIVTATLALLLSLSSFNIIGCGGSGNNNTQGKGGTEGSGKLEGKIVIDGSSTVAPVSEKVAESFKKKHPNVNISVGTSGTGGGFKKFVRGETDISDASRPIKDSEKKEAEENGVEFIELKVAIDGLAVVINKENNWAEKMTVEELKKIWDPDLAAKTWKEVNPKWPDQKIDLYGPGTNSGTFDYFTEAINGKEDRSRTDYTSSENDNEIVKGVSKNKNALGYFGLAYYETSKDTLKVVAIKDKDGTEYVKPSTETVESGEYTPLSRPLYIYVNKKSLKNPVVREFVQFYVRNPEVVSEVGYIQLPESVRFAQQNKLNKTIEQVVSE